MVGYSPSLSRGPLYKDLQAGSLLGSTLKINACGRVKDTGLKRRTACTVMLSQKKISAGLTGSPEALLTIRSHKLQQKSQDFVSLCWLVTGYRLPREGEVILGEVTLLVGAIWIELTTEGFQLTSLPEAGEEGTIFLRRDRNVYYTSSHLVHFTIKGH